MICPAHDQNKETGLAGLFVAHGSSTSLPELAYTNTADDLAGGYRFC